MQYYHDGRVIWQNTLIRGRRTVQPSGKLSFSLKPELEASKTYIVPPSSVRSNVLPFNQNVCTHLTLVTCLSYSTLSTFEKSPMTAYAVCRCPLRRFFSMMETMVRSQEHRELT